MFPYVAPAEKNTHPNNSGEEEGNQLGLSVTKENKAKH